MKKLILIISLLLLYDISFEQGSSKSELPDLFSYRKGDKSSNISYKTNNIQDTCDIIDYGTKNIRLLTTYNKILKKYGKIKPNNEYGHTQGTGYYDPDKKIFLIFGFFDGRTEQIVIANENEINGVPKNGKVKLTSKDITTKKGIKLGMSKKKVKKILGKPINETDDTLTYIVENKHCIINGKVEDINVYQGIYYFFNKKLVKINLENSDG